MSKLALLALFFTLGLTACPSPRPDPLPVPGPTPSASASPVVTPSAAPSARLYGVTLDDTDELDASALPGIIDSLSKLPKRMTVRIVFNPSHNAAWYQSVVQQLSQVADIEGQPADSTYVKALSLSAYTARFRDYVANLPQIKMWEIGNEVNGDWLGSGVPAKVDAAYDIVKGAGKLAVLVPYWNTESCADSNGYWLTWIKNNISAKVKAGTDYVLTSVYGYDCDKGPEPSLADIQSFYYQLADIFPNAMLGIGEYGSGQQTTVAQHAAAIKYYLSLPLLHPKDVFFGGYWYFRQDAVPSSAPNWAVFRDNL